MREGFQPQRLPPSPCEDSKPRGHGGWVEKNRRIGRFICTIQCNSIPDTRHIVIVQAVEEVSDRWITHAADPSNHVSRPSLPPIRKVAEQPAP
jgi:hypothetical protein